MFEPFMINALLASVLIAVVAGPVGSVMVFNRLSFFGDAMSHNALLGIALGLILGLDFDVSVFLVVLASALVFFALKNKEVAKTDTLLCIIAQVGLALGMIAVAMGGAGASRLVNFLFGDILSVGAKDVWLILGGVVVIMAILAKVWKRLIALSFDRQTAMAENGKMLGVDFAFMMIMAIFIALCVKIAGVLLVTALLIIPAAAAKFISKTPEGMAIKSSLVGVVAVCLGLGFAYHLDLPAAPAIVIMAAVLCFFCGGVKKIVHNN